MAYSLIWLKAQFGKLGLSRRGMYAPDGIVITVSLLTIASYNYNYIRLTHLRIHYALREFYKRYANMLWAAQICYGPRECNMRYANTLRKTKTKAQHLYNNFVPDILVMFH